MKKYFPALALVGLLTCSCGLYFRFPKKAEPDQSVYGERRELKTGGVRILDEKDNISWRAPDGYRFLEIGTCVTKKRDGGRQSRVCTWKVEKTGGEPESKKEK